MKRLVSALRTAVLPYSTFRRPAPSRCIQFRVRYVIVFNGEIYNHLGLRRELETQGAAPPWRGHSDTETLLAAIEHWGLDSALQRAYGMFALALWDKRDHELSLARDRVGEKPLYYGRWGDSLLFASELKALFAFPGFSPEIDRDALGAFLRFSYVPAPHSIWRGISKLRPGHILTLRTAADTGHDRTYWSLDEVGETGAVARRTPRDHASMVNETEALLSEVVTSQMISDVPLGAFLSGGIDLSLVAALMQKRAGSPVRTFSIGFESARFNEAEHARAVARHLGTRHTEFTVTERDALALVPQLPQIFDEPFADSSQLPTILLARLAREQVTVALSGDGGDEVFGGYNRYLFAPDLWRSVAWLPGPGRRCLGFAGALAQRFGTGRFAAPIAAALSKLGLPLTTVDKFAKFADAVGRARNFEGFYREIVSTRSDPLTLLRGGREAPSILDDADCHPSTGTPAEFMMALDTLSYLPDDIMVKVDRSSMSCSLEIRAPFLDARVVEHAWTLPLDLKIDKRRGKLILREILDRHVPRALIDRPKQGFGVPIDDWLRGPLRDWAEALLSLDSLYATEWLDAEVVVNLWRQHLSWRVNAGPTLWAVLMFQAWRLAHRNRL